MKVEMLSDDYSRLEKAQMKTIDDLQEKIKLMSFDKTSDRLKIQDLKLKIETKKNTLNAIIQELELMDTYDNIKIKEIIHLLKLVRRDLDN